MITSGIEYGAGSTRCVVVKDGIIIGTGLVPTGTQPVENAESSLEAALRCAGVAKSGIGKTGATGPGRFLAAGADVVIDDVYAAVLAAKSFLPGARTVFSIGDDRSLAAAIGSDGSVSDSVINRDCAAEAGVYLESIGRLVENGQVENGGNEQGTSEIIALNAQCLIFAETEIPALIREGAAPAQILRSAYEAFAVRIASMLQRIGVTEQVVMTGVIPFHPFLLEAVRGRIQVEKIHVPGLPAFAAAAGAAAAAAGRGVSAHRDECGKARRFFPLAWPGSESALERRRKYRPAEAERWKDPGMDLEAASFITVGMDMGSCYAKACVMVDGRISAYVIEYRSGGESQASELYASLLETAGMPRERVDYCVGTGYGRVRIPFADRAITETACQAGGARLIYGASVRTVLDVGGKDIKAIRCDAKGKVTDFVLNDKCAAGTGCAIEVFAGLLGVSVSDVGRRSLQVGKEPPALPDTCVVYAWSRAREILAKGGSTDDLLAAFCRSCAERLHSLLEKAEVAPGLAVTGGGAKNRGVVERLAGLLGFEALKTDWDPQIAGAAGAALFGYAFCVKRKKPRRTGE